MFENAYIISSPFWLRNTVHGESVLFIRQRAPQPPRSALLFEPTKILRVTSSCGNVVFDPGRDVAIEAGSRELMLPVHSKIPFRTPEQLRAPAGSQPHRLTHRDGNGEILFGGGREYHDMQVVVSYEHTGPWPGPVPEFAGAYLPKTVAKLEAGAPFRLVVFGDSITEGWNASKFVKAPPFQPAYGELLAEILQTRFGCPMFFRNFALGGMDSKWGAANIGKVIGARPDLAVLAFGMNDAGGRSAADFELQMRAQIDAIKRALPDTEIVLVAPMLPNPDWTAVKLEYFKPYRDVLEKLCRPCVALADVTSLWAEIMKRKTHLEVTGNGVNHPNDFGHRIYAQILATMLIRDFGSNLTQSR